MKKKVLHLITGLELGGGAENMLLQFLPKMQNNLDNRVCAIRGRGKIGKKLEEAGIPVYYLELKNIFDIGIIFRYKSILKDFKPDVQVNYLIHADIFGRIFGKFFGLHQVVSYIRSFHKIKEKKFFYLMEKMTLSLADFILTNSETMKKYYIDKISVNPDKITCIPNGIDLSRIENLKVNREEKLKEIGMINLEASIEASKNLIIIGTVARLEKIKDIPTLVKAFKIVQEKYTATRLLIVGHGSQNKNIKKLIKKLNIENKVTMLEKRADVLELISIMDIFVLPSLTEGMSNALLEAMALKRLIIASDAEENKEVVIDGRNGLNFKTSDSSNLREKLEKCILNREKFGNLKEIAFKDVISKYELGVVEKIFESFLLSRP